MTTRPAIDDDAAGLRAQLAARVTALRERAGLTKKDAAAAARISARFWADLEHGRANPSVETLEQIAGALGVDVSALFLRTAAGPHLEALARRVRTLDDDTEAAGALDALAGAQGTRAVALLGLRGAGKSAVGQTLARALERPFVEVDRAIEREAGMPLSSIFELHGEAHYRELERRVLEATLDDADAPVLEVSGGVVTDDDTFGLLRRRALTVWLRATPQEHWDRVIAQGDMRPMDGRSRARGELDALYSARAPLYARCELTVDTSGRAVDEVVDMLRRSVTGAPR